MWIQMDLLWIRAFVNKTNWTKIRVPVSTTRSITVSTLSLFLKTKMLNLGFDKAAFIRAARKHIPPKETEASVSNQRGNTRNIDTCLVEPGASKRRSQLKPSVATVSNKGGNARNINTPLLEDVSPKKRKIQKVTKSSSVSKKRAQVNGTSWFK